MLLIYERGRLFRRKCNIDNKAIKSKDIFQATISAQMGSWRER